MANAKAEITEGSGKFIALYSLTEDGNLVHVQRIAHNTNAGLEWTYGAGAAGASTPRFIHASDDPAVVSLVSIDGKLSTIDGRVDGLEGLLTTLGGYLDLVETKLDTIAGSVAGATPAGTNNIGDVDILSIAPGDNNIGNVDVVTVPADPFGANADTAVAAGATGSIQAKLRLMTSQLDAIKTSVELLDNAIAGSELQVDIVTGGVIAGTAGTPSADVLTVQGTGSMTPLKTSGSFVMASTDITRPADTAGYVANDAFANSTSAPTAGGFTLAGMGRASGGSGIITDILIVASAATLYQGELWIFDSAVTAVNDNAAFACSDADAKLLVAIVPFSLVAGVSTNSQQHITGINIGYTCVGSANLRYLVKITNAPTPGNAEVLTVRSKAILLD